MHSWNLVFFVVIFGIVSENVLGVPVQSTNAEMVAKQVGSYEERTVQSKSRSSQNLEKKEIQSSSSTATNSLSLGNNVSIVGGGLSSSIKESEASQRTTSKSEESRKSESRQESTIAESKSFTDKDSKKVFNAVDDTLHSAGVQTVQGQSDSTNTRSQSNIERQSATLAITECSVTGSQNKAEKSARPVLNKEGVANVVVSEKHDSRRAKIIEDGIRKHAESRGSNGFMKSVVAKGSAASKNSAASKGRVANTNGCASKYSNHRVVYKNSAASKYSAAYKQRVSAKKHSASNASAASKYYSSSKYRTSNRKPISRYNSASKNSAARSRYRNTSKAKTASKGKTIANQNLLSKQTSPYMKNTVHYPTSSLLNRSPNYGTASNTNGAYKDTSSSKNAGGPKPIVINLMNFGSKKSTTETHKMISKEKVSSEEKETSKIQTVSQQPNGLNGEKLPSTSQANVEVSRTVTKSRSKHREESSSKKSKARQSLRIIIEHGGAETGGKFHSNAYSRHTAEQKYRNAKSEEKSATTSSQTGGRRESTSSFEARHREVEAAQKAAVSSTMGRTEIVLTQTKASKNQKRKSESSSSSTRESQTISANTGVSAAIKAVSAGSAEAFQ